MKINLKNLFISNTYLLAFVMDVSVSVSFAFATILCVRARVRVFFN